eukprot:CAMPEP_0118862414 /NCGR_PEP_ID=MMETSP1163-20130328/7568_1 /TAXON_ID=124430 /ORGANISM="Phaeomonas parva, Strain CCMP2877" /LENGTH=248 /DNA_ID=CAMNT_0006796319 /DNA_START=370 /DNA_END=1116 /DNA_ORIENTATION=-
MGAGASARLPEGQDAFTEAELRGILGDAFDEAAYKGAAAEDGRVSAAKVREILAAAAPPPPAEGEEAAEAEAAAATPEELAAAAAKARAEELAARADGEATVVYNMYNEAFPVTANAMKASDVDEMYCCSDVMPGCVLKLSTFSTAQRQADPDAFTYVDEEPEGTFVGLLANAEYHLYVIQDAEQARQDMEAIRARQAADAAAQPSDAAPPECKCLEGTPCTNPYHCNFTSDEAKREWDERKKASGLG